MRRRRELTLLLAFAGALGSAAAERVTVADVLRWTHC
jgi:hypothetical protein